MYLKPKKVYPNVVPYNNAYSKEQVIILICFLQYRVGFGCLFNSIDFVQIQRRLDNFLHMGEAARSPDIESQPRLLGEISNWRMKRKEIGASEYISATCLHVNVTMLVKVPLTVQY